MLQVLSPVLPLLTGFLTFFGVLFLVIGLGSTSKRRDPIDLRLEEATKRARSLEEIEMAAPFSERFLRPMMLGISRGVARVMPANVSDDTQKRLMYAGMIGRLQVSDFVGVKALALILGAGLGLAFSFLLQASAFGTLFFTGFLGALGYILPDLWLRSRTAQRQAQLTNELPDIIDLLTISVEAGLGFDQAVARIVSKSETELSREFGRMLQEMRVGIARRDALRAMVLRTGVEDLSTFVTAIIQAEQLGASVGKVLRIQSGEMRVRRRQRAEKLAAQAPIKMLFPLIFLIFPPIFVVVLGPSIPLIIHAFAPGIPL